MEIEVIIKYVLKNHLHNNQFDICLQPCLLEGTQRCFITSQNHGFAVQTFESLTKDWSILFTNQNDYSNEGIIHDCKPFFSVQFHPEHCAGPRDTENLFQIFLDIVQSYKLNKTMNIKSYIIEQLTGHSNNRNSSPQSFCHRVKKVLILGSGGLTIGQAGEFDYSGIIKIKIKFFMYSLSFLRHTSNKVNE